MQQTIYTFIIKPVSKNWGYSSVAEHWLGVSKPWD